MMTVKKQSQPHLRLVFSREDSSGYKSGRSSERDTPEIDSSGITRLGGITPDFRHFWTAWYLTPSFSATDCSPPPPSIARVTDSDMHSNVQPIIAFRQQPMRVWRPDTIQPMVDTAKYTAREEFSRWLNSHADRLHAPSRGRPKWLQKRLKDEVGLNVSYETCRKWLGGLDMPERPNEALLYKALGVQIQAEESDPQFEQLRQIWRTLPDKSRALILDAAALAQSAARSEKPQESRPAIRRKSG